MNSSNVAVICGKLGWAFGLRIVFALEPDLLALARVGTHDEIRRYLEDL